MGGYLAELLRGYRAELRGLRRALQTLAILFFVIMLVEIELGHRPALARGDSWLALVPVVWLPVSLFALMAAQVSPSMGTMIAALIVMAISAAVGMAGSGLHMMAAGVDFDHLSRLFSSDTWGGPVSPNWPVAITVASVLGFIGAADAQGDAPTLTRDALGAVTALAYGLIIVGIGLAAFPAMVAISATSLVIAALLLLAVLVGTLAAASTERSVP
jgi:hypothetical protein